MLLFTYEVCGSKKSKFIRKGEAAGLLSSLGIKKSLFKIPLVIHLLFYKY